ncbi:uncharacterized protein TNCV_4564261 [Trichonephila clavipes]|nr:uncharacterized protein TNCV_4564261 [Trichonephila clavipes]
MKRKENFQMFPKELHQLKYEALSIPKGSVRLVKKTQERKSSTCYLLIIKGVTSSSPVPLKTRHVWGRLQQNFLDRDKYLNYEGSKWQWKNTMSPKRKTSVPGGYLSCQRKSATLVFGYHFDMAKKRILTQDEIDRYMNNLDELSELSEDGLEYSDDDVDLLPDCVSSIEDSDSDNDISVGSQNTIQNFKKIR